MDKKVFEFHGKPGEYFLVFLVSLVMAYVPIFGWPVSFNYSTKWLIENLTISGRKLVYNAGYGETLKFLVVNLLLLIITLGIYSFWFVPKQYRFICDHSSYVE